ncbi:hypothetical protein MKP05_19760 [Halomonas sp. EGI 63088]|uniref:Uncharacterized protein n=1 Tax=Halomonas flagellata TaxID=2920385 RepID=A0ABS9RZT8_9GAMM|nr:hypothetical protein [Halomonas flagellata]MCH4565339.1 hypothetical protein [Halomonas flagellata]
MSAGNIQQPTTKPSPTEWLLYASLVLGIAHHVDHLLRFDHSGWLFRPDVTPFTWSLLVYPVLLFALWAAHRPRLRAIAIGLLFVFPTVAHVIIETPVDQYITWTQRPDVNVLGAASPVMGSMAVFITLALSLCTDLAFASALRDNQRRRTPSNIGTPSTDSETKHTA